MKVIPTGVYMIRNKRNGKFYIGGAYVSFQERWSDHRYDLNRGKHSNFRLQRDWTKYGSEQFSFTVIERRPVEEVQGREQYWIDKLRAVHTGYNLCPVAGSRLGTKMSEEAKRKVSLFNKGKRLTSEHRQKIADATVQRFRKPEERQKISIVRKGWNPNEETRRVMSSSQRARFQTAEGQREAKERNLGRKHSAESRQKMSLSRTGKKHSPETIARMSLAQKKRYARERASLPII